jgi:asparagine synthase (glutamine-hydrolysing)
MTRAIAHRGPDDAGAWLDADAGVALGHRRLSILELSPLGHQPMHSADGRYVIVFNGEIYNHHALREQLRARGHAFRGQSDTEVLLAAVVEWGLHDALERLNGMFAFALWDRRERRLHMARDRAGEKPLYYGWMGGVLLFGSELKALRAHPAFRGEVDRGALALFLRHNYVPTPWSIYHGVRKLPPATYVTFTADAEGEQPEPRAYWSLREVVERGAAEPFGGTPDEAVQELHTLLYDAVRLRMEADVPLGAFLSGGIDSTTVVALMQAQSRTPVRTFTIGFEEAGYNEAVHARAVAAHLGTDHTELYVTPAEAMAVIPRLPVLYDEPFSDSSQVPTFLVAQLARKHVTVALSGDAGDELFAGYDRYRITTDTWRKISRVPAPARRGAAAAITRLSPNGWNRLLGPLYGRLPSRLRQRTAGVRIYQIAELLRFDEPVQVYQRMVSHWRECGDVVIGASEPRTPLSNRREWADVPDFLAQMMYLDARMYLPDDILVKVDRASMGVALESRVPLLDPRVIEFAWQLPATVKVRNGEGKWPLRQVLHQYVPRDLMDRPKMGFGVPIDSWLRGPLRDWAESLLDERRLREEGFFRPEPIRQRWAEHLSGEYDRHYDLWDVLMFQAWLDENDSASAGATPEHVTERSGVVNAGEG